MLRIAHQETRYPLPVKQPHKLVDPRVENRLPNQTQRTMSDRHRFFKSLSSYSRHASHHFDLLVMSLFRAFKYHLWLIYLPTPCCGYWICAMSPAEDALVATRE